MSTTLETSAAPETNAPPFSDMPAPVKEHAWLARFVGEWSSEAELNCQPGQPPRHCTGTETARMLGGFWLVAQGSSEMAGTNFASVLTLGYDPKIGKYIGAWVDSMTSHLWRYEGAVSADGDTLTLDAEAECPNAPGRLSKFIEKTEFKSDDHRVFTSSIQGEDGDWSTMVTVNFRRQK